MRRKNTGGEIQTINMKLERKSFLEECEHQQAVRDPEWESQGTQWRWIYQRRQGKQVPGKEGHVQGKWHLQISSGKNTCKTVHGTGMENYPASVSEFESDIIICQNTEKIWVGIFYDNQQKASIVCAWEGSGRLGFCYLSFFLWIQNQNKTKHPSQYEQPQ